MDWFDIDRTVLLHFTNVTPAQNGITVTEAKVYDDRTLMIMLDQLNDQLRNINFIDRAKLAAQLGMTQGMQSKDVSRSLDIGTVPIPGLTTKSTPDSEGNLAVSEQTETRSGFTPRAPCATRAFGCTAIRPGVWREPVGLAQ